MGNEDAPKHISRPESVCVESGSEDDSGGKTSRMSHIKSPERPKKKTERRRKTGSVKQKTVISTNRGSSTNLRPTGAPKGKSRDCHRSEVVKE